MITYQQKIASKKPSKQRIKYQSENTFFSGTSGCPTSLQSIENETTLKIVSGSNSMFNYLQNLINI